MKLHNFIFPAQQSSQAEKWEVRNFRQNKIWLIKSRFVKISNLSQKRDYVFGKVCWIWDFWVYYKTETHHWNFAFAISSVLQIQFHRKKKLCDNFSGRFTSFTCILYYFLLTQDPKASVTKAVCQWQRLKRLVVLEKFGFWKN